MKTKETKKKEAEARQERYGKLPVKERIEKLDKKFGKGLGAVKERAKLYKEEKK